MFKDEPCTNWITVFPLSSAVCFRTSSLIDSPGQGRPEFYEPLVNLAGTGLAFESHHAKDDGSNAPYHHPVKGSSKEGWLRKSLVEKLVAANKRLEPYGVELLILDAYRSMECQRGIWAFFYERGSRELQTTDDEACTKYALRYARDPRPFDPENSRTFPIHATGASIDVTLQHLKTER